MDKQKNTPRSRSRRRVPNRALSIHFTAPHHPGAVTVWYQSTLLWGCVGAVLSIVCTVLAAMLKDFRWLLLVAWPFATVAVWEFSRTRGSSKPSLWAFGGSITSGIFLAWLYFVLTPPGHPVPIKSETVLSVLSLDNTIRLTCLSESVGLSDLEGNGAWQFQIYGTPATGQDPRSLYTQGPVVRGAPKPHQTGLYAPPWKCTFVNFGKEPVTDVYAKMQVTWLKPTHSLSGPAAGDPIASADFITPPLDLGTSSGDREAYFYVWNTSDSFVSVTIAGSVSLKRVGAEAAEQAKLIDGDKPRVQPFLWPAQKRKTPAVTMRQTDEGAKSPDTEHTLSDVEKRLRDGSF